MVKKDGVKLFLFFGIIFLFLLLNKITYSVENNDTVLKGTREEFQNLITSTALSYYYNKSYSDYEQYGLDSSYSSSAPYYRSFGADNVNIFPEDVSRANYYPMACAAFTEMVYLNTLGYDMSDYYYLSNFFNYKNVDNNLQSIPTNKSIENYKAGYQYYNSSWSTNHITRVGRKEYLKNYYGTELSDEQINKIVKNGTFVETTGDINNILGSNIFSTTNTKLPDMYVSEGNNSIVVFYYKVDLEEENGKRIFSITSEEQEKIKEQMANILQKGDVLVYRRINRDTTSDEIAGHAILYVDDIIGEGTRGFIHSTGNDTILPSSSQWPGYDEYSVRYSDINYFNKYKFFEISDTKIAYELTIIRPLNAICNNDSCSISKDSVSYDKFKNSFSKYVENALARNELSKLRTEQYAKAVSLEKNLSNYSSVNINDNISYNLYLENKTQYEICSSGSTTKEDECKNGTWMTVGNKNAINDLTIIAKVPENTDFVNCNYNCKQITENGKVVSVSWHFSSIKQYVTLSYTVKIKKDNTIIKNDGMVITTSDGNSLKMGELSIKVNNTIENSNINKMSNVIDKFTNLNNNKKIEYSSTDNENYKIMLDNITNIQMSSLDFIKNIYYNSMGIDLNIISVEKVKNAIFNKINNYKLYTKKTDSEISKLTGDDVTINNMLVKGMYGGRLLKGNDNYDRTYYLSRGYFNYGDIIIIYLDGNYRYLMASGKNKTKYYSFVEFTENGVVYYDDGTNGENTSYKTLKEIMYSSDLFIVLRPSQVYDINWYINVFEKVNLDEEKSIINKILPGMNYNELLNNLETKGDILLISNDNKNIINSDIIKTGDRISINYNNINHQFALSVLGDLTGDGQILINDISKMYSYVKGKSALEDEYFNSGDVTHDNKVLINDVSKLYQYIKTGDVSLN